MEVFTGEKYDNAIEDLLKMYIDNLQYDIIIDSLAYQSAAERYFKFNK